MRLRIFIFIGLSLIVLFVGIFGIHSNQKTETRFIDNKAVKEIKDVREIKSSKTVEQLVSLKQKDFQSKRAFSEVPDKTIQKFRTSISRLKELYGSRFHHSGIHDLMEEVSHEDSASAFASTVLLDIEAGKEVFPEDHTILRIFALEYLLYEASKGDDASVRKTLDSLSHKYSDYDENQISQYGRDIDYKQLLLGFLQKLSLKEIEEDLPNLIPETFAKAKDHHFLNKALRQAMITTLDWKYDMEYSEYKDFLPILER